MLFSFTNQVLVQRDLMWYWKETAAYKTDAYILPKLLGEKVALPRAPPCARFGAHRPYTGALCFSILRSVRRNFTCSYVSPLSLRTYQFHAGWIFVTMCRTQLSHVDAMWEARCAADPLCTGAVYSSEYSPANSSCKLNHRWFEHRLFGFIH